MSPAAPRGMHHLAIRVRDLPAAEAFYRSVLGLAVLRRWPADAAAPGGGERSIWLDAGDGGFLALERTTCEPAPPEGERAGLHLVALRIGRHERPAWERHLAAAGVAVQHRTAFTLYLRDPEGNRVGLSHWPEEATG